MAWAPSSDRPCVKAGKCMPPEGAGPGDPREWLRRARSNLARSSQGQVTPDVLFEDTCFDAQQAVEKALKALLVLKGVQVPRTHAISDNLQPLRLVPAIEVGEKRRLVVTVRAPAAADADDQHFVAEAFVRTRQDLAFMSGKLNLNGSVGSFTLECREGSVGSGTSLSLASVARTATSRSCRLRTISSEDDRPY